MTGPTNIQAHRTDAEIFTEARQALDRQPSIPATVRVHVEHRTAWLTGMVLLAAERMEAEDIVRHVPGVERVVNQIVIAAPRSAEGFEPPDEKD